MHRVVFLDRATLDAHIPSPGFPHEWKEFGCTAPGEVRARLAGATMAVVNKVRLDAETLAALPDLRLVVVAATGTDNVDLEACRALGIRVSNVRGYAADSVAEHVVACVLALRRNLFGYRKALLGGAWQRSESFAAHLFPIEEVGGATLAIYGHGAIGQATARRAEALGMQVILPERKGACTTRPGRVPFEEAVARCDVLSLHCPLDATSAGLVDADVLDLLGPSGVLVNTARGGLVDHAALLAALSAGRIGGAALDVLPHEPPVDGHALLERELPNLIITPHVAWASQRAQHTLARRVIERLEAFAAGTLTDSLV
ncbi:MAG: glycerate dehydrogenase [Deltaproteobacteria bacterium]|nr:glycerate dehydrogenase [Deltaproteobacteria bacterium]